MPQWLEDLLRQVEQEEHLADGIRVFGHGLAEQDPEEVRTALDAHAPDVCHSLMHNTPLQGLPYTKEAHEAANAQSAEQLAKNEPVSRH